MLHLMHRDLGPISLPQVGKTSAFIGPFVSSAIITASDGNNNMPFAFLFGLYVTALLAVIQLITYSAAQRNIQHDIPILS